MRNPHIPVVIIIVVLLLGVTLSRRAQRETTPPTPTASGNVNSTQPAAPQGKPTFEWSYRAFEQEEIPRTAISIAARYPDGTVQTHEVDTIEGGCNVYEERDADVYPQSEMIICYYAGLGRYFKVVEAEGEYLVQRRIFEEGSPEYEPPVLPFETVVRVR